MAPNGMLHDGVKALCHATGRLDDKRGGLIDPGIMKECCKEQCQIANFFIGILLCGCQGKPSSAHHVLIAYPERWNEGDRRPCFLGPVGGSTVKGSLEQPDNLVQLDCDRFVQGEVVHRTPMERIFALDVTFTTDIDKALESRRGYVNNETAWTCQRKGDVLTCAP